MDIQEFHQLLVQKNLSPGGMGKSERITIHLPKQFNVFLIISPTPDAIREVINLAEEKEILPGLGEYVTVNSSLRVKDNVRFDPLEERLIRILGSSFHDGSGLTTLRQYGHVVDQGFDPFNWPKGWLNKWQCLRGTGPYKK